MSFTVEKQGNSNELKWISLTEINNDYFTIEKSLEGDNFEIVGLINGAGNSTIKNEYELNDYKIEPVINYYRLKQTDFDGKSIYSELISIDNRIEVNKNREVKFKTNILGQIVDENYLGLVIVVYTDGNSIKIIQ